MMHVRLLSLGVSLGTLAACTTILGNDFEFVATGAGGAGGNGTVAGTGAGSLGGGGDDGCPIGTADCNDDPADGCETTLADDVKHCGMCNRACASTNADAVACVAGECAPTCASGFADCATPAVDDGCEVTLGTDDHCAACGHDCEGGSCTAGECSAYTLATDTGQVPAIALDADTLFWVNDQNYTVKSIPSAGGGVTLLEIGVGSCWRVTFDDTHVYWAARSTNRLGRVPKGGGTDEVVVAAYADAVAVNDTNAFYLMDQGLHITPKDGSGTPDWVASYSSPVDLAVDGNEVFITDAGFQGIRTYNVDTEVSGQLYSVIGADTPDEIAIDATHVYFTGAGSQGKVWSGTRDGQTLIELVSMSGATSGLALTDTHVYFTVPSTGEIRRVPKEGGDNELIEGGQAEVDPIAVDDYAVYWARAGSGDIYKKVLTPEP